MAMMKRATRDEQEMLLAHLADDIENCTYLYLDIFQYGIGSDTVTVWYAKHADAITLVALQYFDCLQVYSRNADFETADLVRLIEETGVIKVRGNRACIEAIEHVLEDRFEAEYGTVIEKVKARDFGELFERVQEATIEDIPEVASLILTDETNKALFSQEGLEKSLSNLIKNGTGHVYLMREDGKAVASETVDAESDLFIIGAYLITHPDYRHLLYGTVVESYVYRRVKGDRRLFTFVTEPRRRRMLTAQGNPIVAEYGKLVARHP